MAGPEAPHGDMKVAEIGYRSMFGAGFVLALAGQWLGHEEALRRSGRNSMARSAPRFRGDFLRLEVWAYFSLSFPCQGLPGSHHTLEERIDSIGTHYDPESSLPLREPPKKSQKKPC
jgi:hypothetical protein